MKPLAYYTQEAGVSLDRLIEETGLEARVVKAIVSSQYTPSPEQRQRLAAAVNVAPQDVSWDHAAPVEHMYGHGPQFGRTP